MEPRETRAARRPCVVKEPPHAEKQHAREPGDLQAASVPSGPRPGREGETPHGGHARPGGVGLHRSVRRAAARSGRLKSSWRSDGERHIQKRGLCLAGLGRSDRGGQGVHREVESEGLAEKLRAVIDGGCPDDEPVGQRGGKVESALWRRRRYPSTPRTKVCADGTERKNTT
jgi:hypothetical protein